METTGATSVSPWQITLLMAAVATLGGVVAYLFRLYNKRIIRTENDRRAQDRSQAEERKAWSEERAAWDHEREAESERLRADYEEKHRELLERYMEAGRLDREINRAHEDLVRKEFAELMEQVAKQASVASAELTTLLHKMHDRFLGGPRRRGG